MTASIQTASIIDTGHAERDTHLCSADFLDVRRYPTLEYRSTGIQRQQVGDPNRSSSVVLGTIRTGRISSGSARPPRSTGRTTAWSGTCCRTAAVFWSRRSAGADGGRPPGHWPLAAGRLTADRGGPGRRSGGAAPDNGGGQ
ncbi:YceI family protein [Micromonospora sp. NBC_01813]|uniref:YceI family protein n=1 Tax=Micromonospora sp. NBC_01813 TaxID=2975988 RepID=UPI002DDAD6CE|nr:YceI family protein [Micromonospora sp. NBC_01813]WSA10947.1 YceI family protein [Micromonospora sp. NBC_01813]